MLLELCLEENSMTSVFNLSMLQCIQDSMSLKQISMGPYDLTNWRNVVFLTQYRSQWYTTFHQDRFGQLTIETQPGTYLWDMTLSRRVVFPRYRSNVHGDAVTCGDLWCQMLQTNQAKRARKHNLDQGTVECHFILWAELMILPVYWLIIFKDRVYHNVPVQAWINNLLQHLRDEYSTSGYRPSVLASWGEAWYKHTWSPWHRSSAPLKYLWYLSQEVGAHPDIPTTAVSARDQVISW